MHGLTKTGESMQKTDYGLTTPRACACMCVFVDMCVFVVVFVCVLFEPINTQTRQQGSEAEFK